MDLHDLLNRLKNGDDRAYRQAFDQFFPLLISVAYRILGSSDDAKDVVQEVFIRMYSRREYLEINDLKYYLVRSVKNECLNHLKSRDRLRLHHQQYSLSIDEAIVADLLEHAEKEERIYLAIRDLPPQCRKVFTMSRLEDKDNGQIAIELGVSIRTVETHISNALKFLRKKLSIVSIFF